VVVPGVGDVVEVVACALAAVAEVLDLYGLEAELVGLRVLGLDAVAVVGLRAPLPAARTWAEPPAETADAETWTNSSAAPTAATDAARTRVLRRDAGMSGTPSGRLLET
jgi:hypothetical protein